MTDEDDESPKTNKGYVKLHRQIFENHFLMHDDTAWLVFTKLLLIVGKTKGEWSGGRRQLAELININPNTLYKALQRLENQQIINRFSNRRYSVIHIRNWHKYQQDRQPLQQPHGNHTVTTREPHGNTLTRKNSINVLKKYINENYGQLEKELIDFLEMREAIKRPLTQSGIDYQVKALDKLYPNDLDNQRACLRQSVMNAWQGLFPIKADKQIREFA